MSNHQAQQQQRQPEPWKPGKNTFVLVQSDPGVEERARQWIQNEWIGCDDLSPTRIVTSLNARRLQAHHEVVVLYEDREALIEEGGKLRRRRMAKKNAATKEWEPEENPVMQCCKAISCGPLFIDRGELGDSGVRLENTPASANQPEKLGLMQSIVNACCGKAAIGGGKRVSVVCARDAGQPDIIKVTAFG